MKINSHDRFPHGRLDALGYDWGRVGNRNVEPRFPRTVYFPQNAEDTVEAVRREAGNEPFRIRGKGHSDNDLILADRGTAVICTDRLTSIGEISEDGDDFWVRVGAGVEIDDLEEHLATKARTPLGLPVRPDHGEISVGGLASVGGVSSSCHLHGLFVDNIRTIELVDRRGEHHPAIERGKDAGLEKALASAGEAGVIVSLVCRAVPVDKKHRLLRTQSREFDETESARYAREFKQLAENVPGLDHPSEHGPPLHVRGVWLNVPGRKGGFIVEHYRVMGDPGIKAWRQRDQLRSQLDRIGSVAGTLEAPLDQFEAGLKQLGIGTLIRALRNAAYLTDFDVETFTDRVIDTSVGSPGFMLAAFLPLGEFEQTFEDLLEQCNQANEIALSVIYARPIRSRYLSGPGTGSPAKYADLSIFMFLKPEEIAWPAGAANVESIRRFMDDRSMLVNRRSKEPMFRYIATRTEFRPADRDDRNPNFRWR